MGVHITPLFGHPTQRRRDNPTVRDTQIPATTMNVQSQAPFYIFWAYVKQPCMERQANGCHEPPITCSEWRLVYSEPSSRSLRSRPARSCSMAKERQKVKKSTVIRLLVLCPPLCLPLGCTAHQRVTLRFWCDLVPGSDPGAFWPLLRRLLRGFLLASPLRVVLEQAFSGLDAVLVKSVE